MGFWDLFKGKSAEPQPGGTLGVGELVRRLGTTEPELRGFKPAYREFTIPKRSGGARTILAPEPALKAMQRRILHKLLRRLKAHAGATGFEHGHSIATNADYHAGQAVVLHMDIENFFDSTSAKRIEAYFRKIGWDREAAALLTTLCTWQGRLPQGAPTSPRSSNLVNFRLDARLTAIAELGRFAFQGSLPTGRSHEAEPLRHNVGIGYSRYADDIVFSFDQDHHQAIQDVIWLTKQVVADEGYKLHQKKKLRIMRRHDRQVVTGLVVNTRANLPRRTRRWLRAVEHHLRTGKEAMLTEQQLNGWHALQSMIAAQSDADP